VKPPVLLIWGASYLLGSIPTGYWLGKLWKGVDVRRFGSGNLGATNVFRVLGKGAGAVTLALDIAKGLAPVLLVRRLFPGEPWLAIGAGAGAILGHTTSVFVGFRGGKGVATSAGVFLALLPVPSCVALATFAVCLAITRIVSLSSLAAALALSAASLFLAPSRALRGAAVLVTIFVFWTHRHNIRRLMNGQELRIQGPGKI